ncbi:pyruvate dehydrogenase protein x component mitochondrial precursor [Papiliotrema laurentii]|uniref:Pyruvate dehydrogenase protein x component mitochondrial n=1 Tax=Papiliotrema laurentii TaxID=5418 RepID=A0AAD9FW02_PAPLA|nr:pyruvate dehydrogenase protein x component mitochondrial precursor [Papiliotrema laurentii]
MSSSRIARVIARTAASKVHVRYATTAMRMPAMSPTMTEGGIASWKKQEGEAFASGDVLLEVETDKATIDVEAQEDGVMGKIIAQAGSSKIPVGQVIAMLAEEGDDLSSIEIPKDLAPEASAGPSSSAAESTEKPKEEPKPQAAKEETPAQQQVGHSHHKEIRHPKPLFPSVSRLLLESSLSTEEISKLKGTGKGGMLTKGDVLLALGKVKNAWGSAEKLNLDVMGPSGKRKSEQAETKATAPSEAPKQEAPLDGPALRRLIVSGMSKATQPATPIVPHNPLPLSQDALFDSILAPYASLLPPAQPKVSIPSPEQLEAPKKDEWAGLW